MKAKMKKILVVLLCVLLAVSVSACGGDNNSSQTSSSPSSTADSQTSSESQAEESSEASEPASGDAVTLTIFRESTRPMNEKTDTIRDYVRETLGVDMDVIQVAENGPQQLALMITNGEMPDLMLLSLDNYLDYVSQGAFTDISGDLANYPNLQAYADGYWDGVTVDGGIYGVPSLLPYPTNHVTAIRKDWLDKLGLDMPTTLEEWENVMRAFTFDDPDGNGQNDTYGFFGKGFSYLGTILGAFDATSDEFYFLNDDNTITTNAISDEYRKGLTYLRDLYAEGLIDPEIFTASQDQAYQKWCRGQFGMWTCWWSHAGNSYLRFGFGELQPDADVQIIYPPVGANGEQGGLYAEPISYVVAVSGSLTPEKKEAALRLLDFGATREGFCTVMWGIKDIDYGTDDNGNIVWTWGTNGGKDANGVEVTDMELYKFLYNEPIQREVDSMGTEISSKMYGDATVVQANSTSRADIFAFTRTDEYMEYHTELEKYFEENSIRFIMGEKDIDTEWDQYKSEYLSMGGEEVRQSMLKAYNESHGTSYTFRE